MATQPNTPDSGRVPHLSQARINAARDALLRFPTDELADFVTLAIDLLDRRDGDADLEPDGDELDGSMAEDDFCPQHGGLSGPGCPLADPDLAADDVPCDEPLQDLEEEEPFAGEYGIDQADCAVSLQTVLVHDLRASRKFRDRVRQTSCDHYPLAVIPYRLRN